MSLRHDAGASVCTKYCGENGRALYLKILGESSIGGGTAVKPVRVKTTPVLKHVQWGPLVPVVISGTGAVLIGNYAFWYTEKKQL